MVITYLINHRDHRREIARGRERERDRNREGQVHMGTVIHVRPAMVHRYVAIGERNDLEGEMRRVNATLGGRGLEDVQVRGEGGEGTAVM